MPHGISLFLPLDNETSHLKLPMLKEWKLTSDPSECYRKLTSYSPLKETVIYKTQLPGLHLTLLQLRVSSYLSYFLSKVFGENPTDTLYIQ
jgi:hypothetical protein